MLEIKIFINNCFSAPTVSTSASSKQKDTASASTSSSRVTSGNFFNNLVLSAGVSSNSFFSTNSNSVLTTEKVKEHTTYETVITMI